MNSRFEVLESAAERRSLAAFRSSSAVGVVLTLFAIGAFVSPSTELREPPRGNLFAMEVGDLATVASSSDLAVTSGTPQWNAVIANTDEFALSLNDAVDVAY